MSQESKYHTAAKAVDIAKAESCRILEHLTHLAECSTEVSSRSKQSAAQQHPGRGSNVGTLPASLPLEQLNPETSTTSKVYKDMNRSKKQRKGLTTLAAICSSVFLLAACEPGTEQTGEGADETAPTYGEPDRDPQQPAEETQPGQDPAAPDQQQQEQPGADPWEDDAGGTSDPADTSPQ